jgi:iron complex transport system permease protein
VSQLISWRRRIRPRTAAAILIAALVAVVVSAVALFSGEYLASPAEVVAALTGSGSAADNAVLVSLRAPRVLLALAIGAALGVSGAIAQTVARNGLATPELLGVTGGASVGAIAVIVLGGSSGQFTDFARALGIPTAAILGGLVAAAIILVVLRAVGTSGAAPILVGIGLSATFAGLVSWLLIVASLDELSRANVWLTGSLNGRSWPELFSVTVVLALCAVALVPMVRNLDTLTLGDEVASGLGVRVGRTTAVFIVVAVILAATTTAAAGPIAFVSLVAPHVARMVQARPRPNLTLCALIGACLTAASDLAARTIAVVQLPTGAITAIVGAPFLVFLLLQQRKEHR